MKNSAFYSVLKQKKMKQRTFIYVGLFFLISIILGGIIFFKQTGFFSNEETYEMLHQSDYQEQEQQALDQTNDEYDEETRQMLAEREAEIERLKEIGEWKEPDQSKNNDIIFIIPLIVIGAFFFIFRFLFRKGFNQSGSFAQPKRSSFTQGLSHMASKMKGNFEKIPFDEMMKDPNISDEDKKAFRKVKSISWP
jgi:preprotein translocase subunit SecG